MKKNDKGKRDMEPQKSSAAQCLTYIASYGITDEKFEIRYEDEAKNAKGNGDNFAESTSKQ